jgi:hypothetical protein
LWFEIPEDRNISRATAWSRNDFVKVKVADRTLSRYGTAAENGMFAFRVAGLEINFLAAGAARGRLCT